MEEIPRDARFSVDMSVECYPSMLSSFPLEEIGEKAFSDYSFGGEIKNISSGGACILTTHLLKINDVLKVSFPIPSPISSYISAPRTLVEVRWVKPLDQKECFIHGVRFLL